MRRRSAGVRLHEIPRMGDIGENDLNRGSPQLLRVRNICHLDKRVHFISSNQLLFMGDLSRHISTLFYLPFMSCAHTVEKQMGYFIHHVM